MATRSEDAGNLERDQSREKTSSARPHCVGTCGHLSHAPISGDIMALKTGERLCGDAPFGMEE